MDNRPTIVDLFSGCGGFGLGAELAGFHTRVAVDIDPELQSAYRLNFPYSKALLADVSTLDSEDWSVLLEGERPDGVIGGPPCQGFSRIGHRNADDPRNSLLSMFFRQVNILRPKFFVMENVEGLLDKRNEAVLEAALGLIPDSYVVVGPTLIDAADYGAATHRRRVLLIGYLRQHVAPIDQQIFAPTSDRATVLDAISDLPEPIPQSDDPTDFGWTDGLAHSPTSPYAKRARELPPSHLGWPKAVERLRAGQLSGLFHTQHTEAVKQRFAVLTPGRTDEVSKFPRLSWTGRSPTLRAGTGSERGSYQSVRPIHPDSPRVITVREAARLQGFPDWFVFHPAKWHSFRMIGNSVSPYVSKTILARIGEVLTQKLAA